MLGELEAKHGHHAKARELFMTGLDRDPHCLAVYHAAALLEAKLGNLEGLAALHESAKQHFKNHQFVDSTSGSHNNEVNECVHTEDYYYYYYECLVPLLRMNV